jgi:hypothetical protein
MVNGDIPLLTTADVIRVVTSGADVIRVVTSGGDVISVVTSGAGVIRVVTSGADVEEVGVVMGVQFCHADDVRSVIILGADLALGVALQSSQRVHG